MAEKYDAGKIQVLEGLDAVRMRPGMYIGSTNSRGLHHLLWEIVDNAIDEAANGYATKVEVILHKDGSATVTDNGRGIPVDKHPQLGVSGVEVVYTQLHAGGKFNNENYAYSGGLHGVGASVVNALSEWLTVEVYTDWSAYRQEFESRYDPKTKKILSGHPKGPLERLGNTRKKGTKVTFLPDSRVFETIEFGHDTVKRRLKELAFLNDGVEIVFIDERRREEKGPYKRSYCYHRGLADFIEYVNKDKNALHESPILLQGEKEGIRIQIAVQYTDSYTENIFSYVNNIPTPEGGTHETGFKAGLTKVMNDTARRLGVLKEKDSNLSGEDYREGITAILSLKMKNIQFEGQTKAKLGNSEARTAVDAVTQEQLSQYFEELANQETAQKILTKAVQAAKVREASRKTKETIRKMNKLDSAPLVGKLSSCTGRKPVDNELFIVEGDSAGGSAKQGRDRRYQAILPLRGKPLNAEKKRLDQVLENEEFRTIITALGTGIGDDFNVKALRYHKVIILADADQDGGHIRAILLTFFFRYMRELITEGHVYIGQPPLYRIKKGAKEEYVYDDRALQKALKKYGKGYTIQRYKGLGEMDASQLWETTMDPLHRNLVQVNVEDAAEADRVVTILMGDKVEPRKEYLSEYANFNRVDEFENMEVNHAE
ncbi:DNA gyrase/topoisomerase IV subunit B [Gehongia tenuis]|uniref:DNA topoisomerase (ATP-hydrolyzing) n=1 Tax=Gehongia tenuis TaxID=2763655 RepID=A0A926D4G6_9FIRM|nr:DNA topoisomerase subunit B [Gehongia tenuis]MBC8530744.1 type IIA DNA topoisomerase subunit B [Gehongia tenuis]